LAVTLEDALKVVGASHVIAAVDWIDNQCTAEDFSNLYRRTGRKPPRHRYVEYKGRRYPAKAFGYLVLQIAGNTVQTDSDLTVNMVTGPLKKFGVKAAR
jgi:hypothetical protein